ncbi:L,D-transpeptidase family protein [Streptomyces sp. NPDC091272]|uniref:L,D-transpeptidase family protein n=1 Tax=Streptomyces sp. NPDC091272 TaxID=3365981 RepID=UPI0037FF66B4
MNTPRATARRHRMRAAACAVVALAVAPSACGGPGKAPGPGPTRQAAQVPGGADGNAAEPRSAHPRAVLPAELPGLGPRTRGEIGKDTRQALVVTGKDRDSTDAGAVLYEKTAHGWRTARSWSAQNARRGWTDHHVQGDLRSPIGVFGLTDAGGLLPDPGTRLPYDHGRGYRINRTDASGQSLRGSFDYVVAINYNRRAGHNPLDWGRPLGADRGGGIWLHVEHTTPTSGCVALKREAMKELLQALDPAKKPVVVMGPTTDLAK